MFSHPSFDHHELVAHHEDPETGLKAIIAVHSTVHGPALGGCRMFDYASEQDALTDVLRLSKGMSYKTALAGLPLGGGKSVIIGNPAKLKSPELMQAMGRFVERLNGQYIAAEDSGTSVADLVEMSKVTQHAAGVNAEHASGGDPSPSTALGVFLSIKAAVQFKFGTSLEGIKVAIQGVGNVGRHLVTHLIEAGATVYVSDINASNLERAVALGATEVSHEELHRMGAEVFAPCAMGASINERFVAETDAKIVAGAANNQLANDSMGDLLVEKGILYAPDYLINAGGIIDAYYQTQGLNNSVELSTAIENIPARLLQVFDSAESMGVSPAVSADALAREILRGGR